MSDIRIRKEGRAGRITLTCPQRLNALTYDMSRATERALHAWRDDASIDLVLIDAEGTRAFCAGGDIGAIYRAGQSGGNDHGQEFWREEYRMNAKMAEYPKPVVSFLQGFTMGAGVGIGGHCSHRAVGDTSEVSMPDCRLGFVPDVGGSFLLARAPGRLGEYLGLTAGRMGPGDAIHAGFADHYLPEAEWEALKERLIGSGDADAVADAARPAPKSPLAARQSRIDELFSGASLSEVLAALRTDRSAFAWQTLEAIEGNAPRSVAVTLELVRLLRAPDATIRTALQLEYRIACRIVTYGDFLEGIRAAVVDKDRKPAWSHRLDDVTSDQIARLLAPLGSDELTFKEELA